MSIEGSEGVLSSKIECGEREGSARTERDEDTFAVTTRASGGKTFLAGRY